MVVASSPPIGGKVVIMIEGVVASTVGGFVGFGLHLLSVEPPRAIFVDVVEPEKHSAFSGDLRNALS